MTIVTKSRPVLAHPREVAHLVFAAGQAIARFMMTRRQVRQMSEMPDYILTDIGLKRDDISSALSAGWREDPTYRLALIAAKRRRGLAD